MQTRSFRAVALAIACSLSSSAFAALWTSFPVGKLAGFANAIAPLPDGRFVRGGNGSLFVQNTFGSSAQTTIPSGSAVFDPSFLVVKDGGLALIGAGGFGGPSGLFTFNPFSPGTAVVTPAIATTQNYSASYWRHPTSGREGWLIGGGNGSSITTPFGSANAHNVIFVSLDGTKTGAITADLSTYSSGITVDAAGNLYAALYEAVGSTNEADAEKVLKFTAADIDAAVAAVIAGMPAPVARSNGALVHQFNGASSIAVDALNRVWATSAFKTDYLECFDPATGLTRSFKPDHAKLTGASGPVAYQLITFSRSGTNYVGFLASDSFTATNSSLIYGYAPLSALPVRAVSFATSTQAVVENAGTVTVTVNVNPAPTAKLTIPFTLGGTATKGADYSIATSSVIINAGQTTGTINVNVTNDIADEDNDAETVVLTLGTPSPSVDAFTDPAQKQFTLTINDDDLKPLVNTTQTFPTLRVGTAFNYSLAMLGGPAAKFSAKGLPPGLTLNALTGMISGTPSAPGQFDQVWITVSNAAGTSKSIGFLMTVDDFPAIQHGSFIGLLDFSSPITNGLGGRLDLTVTSNARYTGKLVIGRASYKVSGALDTSALNATGAITIPAGTLNFTINAKGGELGGTGLAGWRTLTSTTLIGTHNLALNSASLAARLDVPLGSSYATAKVTSNAKVTLAGRAADGSAFSTASTLGERGEVLLYQVLYTVPGALAGTLMIAGDEAHSITGACDWSKPPQTSGAVYRNGWTPVFALTASGGKYRPVSGAMIAMNAIPRATANARLTLLDGGIVAITATPEVDLRLSAPSVVSIAAPHKLSINNSTGAVSGSVVFGTGALKKTIAVQALLIPDTGTPDPYDSTAQGWFLLPQTGGATLGGKVSLAPLP